MYVLRNSTALCLLCIGVGILQSEVAQAGLAEDQFQAASDSFAAGRCETAAKQFQAFLDSFADHPLAGQARFFLGESLMECGEFTAARRSFRDSLVSIPSHRYGKRAEFRLGEAAYLEGDRQVAKTTLRDFHLNHPADPLSAHALQILVQLAFDNQEDDQVDQLGREFVAQFRGHPLVSAVQVTRARSHLRTGDPDAAVELLRGVRAKGPDPASRAEATYYFAVALLESGRAAEGWEVFAEIKSQHPESAYFCAAVYELARAAAASGQLSQACDQLRRLPLERCQRSLRVDVLYALGEFAAQQSQWSEVEAPLRRLLDEAPESECCKAACYYLGEANFRQGKFAEAEKYFHELANNTELPRSNWVAIVLLRRAQLRLREGDWQQAFELGSQIQSQFSEFGQQYEVDYLLGRCMAAAARFREARERYQRVITSESGRETEFAAISQWMIGESYFHQRDFERAIDAYAQVQRYERFPTWQAAALLQIGKCHELLGRAAEARAQYERLLQDEAGTPFAREARERFELSLQAGRNPSGLP